MGDSEDYAPVTTPEDEEEEQRRRDSLNGYTGATPAPSEFTAGALNPALGDVPSSGYAPVAPVTPALGSTTDLEARAAQPHIAPLAPPPEPSPAQSRLEKLTAQGAPPVEPLHGWKKALDIVGQAIPRTRGLEQELRYGPQREYEKNLGLAEKDVAAEGASAKEKRAAETETAENTLRGAQTTEAEARAEALRRPPEKVGQRGAEQTLHDLMTGDNGQPRINPDTQKPYTYLEAFKATSEAAAEAKPEHTDAKDKDIGDYLAANNLLDTPANREKARNAIAQRGKQEPGNFMPLYDEKGHVTGAWDPKSGRVVRTPEGSLPGTTGQGLTADRKVVAEHDKAYVQPAEAVEKSYQMMNSAFNEYEAARKQGKTLPTGAQSMLALSTHLSTTFGNVKGARVTKDMIQEHLGARSVSDSALVAIQKLTNGDVLSPDQWKAFHDLISESRKVSWQTAAKEADRKHIPVDFLPGDLKNVPHEAGASEELKPPKEADAGMKWQHRTVNGKTEWRQVKQ